MARISLSQQLSELREYTARLEVELAAAKDTVRTLRIRPAPAIAAARSVSPGARSLDQAAQHRSEAARELCKHLGVGCVTRQQVDHFLGS